MLWLALAAMAAPADTTWPLCGRVAAAQSGTWPEGMPCPAQRHNEPTASDYPLSATYGPERLSNPYDRYAWHRGLDIPTPCGTPVFAIQDGLVTVAGDTTSYSSKTIRIRHGDFEGCTEGCLHSEYQHLSGIRVQSGHKVRVGDHIGWTGFFGLGRDEVGSVNTLCAQPHNDLSEYLHLEVRQAPIDDRFSAWSRDAIHPLTVLPYSDQGADDLRVSIDAVDTGVPYAPVVMVTAQILNDEELDLDAIHVQLIDRSDLVWWEIPQPGDTPGAQGYRVQPSSLDFQDWNRAWTHKNSSLVPWSSFGSCPFGHLHGTSYDANVHTEALDPNDSRLLAFNGVTMWVRRFQLSTVVWSATVRFEELVGTRYGNDLCVRAWAEDIHGNRTDIATHNCRR